MENKEKKIEDEDDELDYFIKPHPIKISFNY